MQCHAWDKRLTEENRPRVYDVSTPLSPFNFPSEPMPLYVLKNRGLVPTSCLPADPSLPLLRNPSDDLVLKLTHSGVTFLGSYNEQEKKYEATGRFRKRYTGCKTSAVDHTGRIWLDARELEYHAKKQKEIPKKKSAGVPPSALKLYDDLNRSGDLSEQVQISAENTTSENFALNIAKNPRKKAYKVDKAKVRQRILGYINTQKGKKHLFFWTVSFPEHTADDVCYQAFNVWLTALRQRGMLREYLWVAERQMGERLKTNKAPTHTIHFHIAIPHYLDVHRANAMMRGTLKGLAKKGLLPGVVCNARTKESYYLPSIAKYNGVDICKHRTTRKPINFAVKKGARALAHYLTKYVTKNDAGQLNDAGELIAPGFTHLAWHNSRGFSALFTGVTCTIAEFSKMGLGGYLNRVRVFSMNFAVFIPWLFGPPPLLLDHLYKLNSKIQSFQDG